MFFKGDNTQSFEYRRNEFCHKILDRLYRHASPIIRENTVAKMMEGIEGTMISNKYFPSVDIADFPTKFSEPDVFIQDCCEFLEMNNHIEVFKANDIIYKIKFKKLGVDAFKIDYYLKQTSSITSTASKINNIKQLVDTDNCWCCSCFCHIRVL